MSEILDVVRKNIESGLWKREDVIKRGLQRNLPVKEYIKKKCIKCGKNIPKTRKAKCCSKECSKFFFERIYSGRWFKYPSNCEQCGLQTKFLELHHIIPLKIIKTYDKFPLGLLFHRDNFKYLCEACHKKTLPNPYLHLINQAIESTDCHVKRQRRLGNNGKKHYIKSH